MRAFIAVAALTASPAFGAGPATQPAKAAPSESASIRDEANSGLEALSASDYAAAAIHFEAARENASRLALQSVARRVAALNSGFKADESRFTLATSSTLQFDKFLKDRETVETRFINPEGKVVVVRVFGEEDDMKDFMFIADNPEKIKQAALEKALMPGGPALKRRTADGGLSVLMMSEKDHALIEVIGASEADVMDVVDAMEGKSN